MADASGFGARSVLPRSQDRLKIPRSARETSLIIVMTIGLWSVIDDGDGSSSLVLCRAKALPCLEEMDKQQGGRSESHRA